MRMNEIGVLIDDSLRKGDSLHFCSRIDSDAEHGDDGSGIELIHQLKRLFDRFFIFPRTAKEKIMTVIDIQFRTVLGGLDDILSSK